MMTKKTKRVLAVDDDGLVRKTLEIFLREAGYQPTVVSGGDEALAALSEQHFDLLITDIRMPGMDGLQIIQASRDYCRQMGKPPIPEIVLTAYNDEPVKQSAARMGIRDFILKPFRAEEFLRTLERNLLSR
ncbi:MAG: Nitrogen regulation protein NR(I) [Candidatus Omnitrophica bacterium ADurb.Bin314]|jgi:CheY-like chemotaxis protein|nr:MAG: Nitrogen regulation protein NR(I) [Candidatus Omnitrophica bacterium ADurb.Bin314]HOE68745.1 response regulator [Candidatus Omnitrophota bacterium]